VPLAMSPQVRVIPRCGMDFASSISFISYAQRQWASFSWIAVCLTLTSVTGCLEQSAGELCDSTNIVAFDEVSYNIGGTWAPLTSSGNASASRVHFREDNSPAWLGGAGCAMDPSVCVTFGCSRYEDIPLELNGANETPGGDWDGGGNRVVLVEVEVSEKGYVLGWAPSRTSEVTVQLDVSVQSEQEMKVGFGNPPIGVHDYVRVE
jgi:hypothetical protein